MVRIKSKNTKNKLTNVSILTIIDKEIPGKIMKGRLVGSTQLQLKSQFRIC